VCFFLALNVEKSVTITPVKKPGYELIEKGLEDLEHGLETVESLLVRIGGPRLRRLGFDVPQLSGELPEHRLYKLLAAENSDSAHSRYNALIRRLVSFERASECGI
jgi:hypothetical protein